MTNQSLNDNFLSHPFYIYETKKCHGYVYSPIDSLYHTCNKHNIKRYLSKDSEVPEIISIDLRCLMDIASDKIPINPDLILIPSTMKYRKRTSNDLFTYSLEQPTSNPEFNIYMDNLIPQEYDRTLFRHFLKLSLTSPINKEQITPRCHIIVRGDKSDVDALFSILLKLDPIIKQGRASLYCESNVNKITLDEIHQSRIVLCDIGHRTLRIANPPYNKTYERPIQYHGLVYQNQPINPSSKEIYDRTINIATINNDVTFTSSDVLGWILSDK